MFAWEGGRGDSDCRTPGPTGEIGIYPCFLRSSRASSGIGCTLCLLPQDVYFFWITSRPSSDVIGAVHPIPPPSPNESAMESLPQELIGKVIDILPHSSLYPCSLVGRRWRRRSQELIFALVIFRSERRLVHWCANIPQDPGSIPSYVRSAEFHDIYFSREPALFGRVLKTFTSMTSLEITTADLPSSLPFGEFGRNIEYLMLLSPRCTVATIRALVFSLPNLENLSLS